MRTLKKSLCLVLALVFVLGLCTVGSNAAYANYTDLAKVTYGEAVEVLTGLGVIEGYPDGSFNPTANVTRAEAAAMITRMMLGREAADKLPIGDVKFTDVPETNWAAKYIAFCANKGIIVGMGDGTFRPSENVTGTQMATMLLRALGYGVIGEYEGKGWDINAVADALYYGVFKDSKVTDFNQPATREENALYCWNTMRLEMVGYDVDLNYYDGKGTTFAGQAFNLSWRRYAQVIANKATGSDYTIVRYRNGYDQVAVRDDDGNIVYDEDDKIVYREVVHYDTITLDQETGLDLIGHEVTVYYRGGQKEDKVNHVWYNETFLIIDTSTVYIPGMSFASYDDMYRYLKDANKENATRTFASVEKWVNYDYTEATVVGGVFDWDDFTLYTTVEGLKGQKSSSDIAWLWIGGTWILDHEGKILLMLDTNYKVGQVKAVDTDHDEVEVDVYTGDDGEIFDMKWKDVDLVYEGIAKDDYVVVQPVGELTYLQATETVDIVVEEIHDLAGSVYFNNGAYSADRYGLGINIEDMVDPDKILEDVGPGDEIRLYIIKGAFSTTFFGVVVLEKAKSEGTMYVVYKDEVLEHGDWDSDENGYTYAYKVQCINQDGEEVVYKMRHRVDDDNNVKEADKAAFDALKVGAVYDVYAGRYATFTATTNTKFTKVAGRNSYLKGTYDNYFITKDTKVVYFSGKGKTLDITVSSKLIDNEAKEDYVVYGVAKKSGGSYKLVTVWVPEQDAPEDYSDSYIYLKSGRNTYTKKFTGYNKPTGEELFEDESDPYFTIYIDGVKKEHIHLYSYYDIYDAAGYQIKSGFYKCTPANDEETLFEIAPVNVEKYVQETVTLTKGSVLKDGSKFYLYTDKTDGEEIKCDIVDVSGDTTINTKQNANVNSLQRLYDLLLADYTIKVDYMYTMDADNINQIPTGVIYVTRVLVPGADDPDID